MLINALTRRVNSLSKYSSQLRLQWLLKRLLTAPFRVSRSAEQTMTTKKKKSLNKISCVKQTNIWQPIRSPPVKWWQCERFLAAVDLNPSRETVQWEKGKEWKIIAEKKSIENTCVEPIRARTKLRRCDWQSHTKESKIKQGKRRRPEIGIPRDEKTEKCVCVTISKNERTEERKIFTLSLFRDEKKSLIFYFVYVFVLLHERLNYNIFSSFSRLLLLNPLFGIPAKT